MLYLLFLGFRMDLGWALWMAGNAFISLLTKKMKHKQKKVPRKRDDDFCQHFFFICLLIFHIIWAFVGYFALLAYFSCSLCFDHFMIFFPAAVASFFYLGFWWMRDIVILFFSVFVSERHNYIAIRRWFKTVSFRLVRI